MGRREGADPAYSFLRDCLNSPRHCMARGKTNSESLQRQRYPSLVGYDQMLMTVGPAGFTVRSLQMDRHPGLHRVIHRKGQERIVDFFGWAAYEEADTRHAAIPDKPQ